MNEWKPRQESAHRHRFDVVVPTFIISFFPSARTTTTTTENYENNQSKKEKPN